MKQDAFQEQVNPSHVWLMSILGNISLNSQWSPKHLLAFYYVHLIVAASCAHFWQAAEKWWLAVFLHSLIFNVGFWACFQITAPVWFFGSLFTSLLGCNKYLIWMWADSSVTKRSRDKKSLHAFTAQINTQGSDNQNHDCMPRRRWIK